MYVLGLLQLHKQVTWMDVSKLDIFHHVYDILKIVVSVMVPFVQAFVIAVDSITN